MARPETKSRAALVWAGIFAVTLAAYWPSLHGGFVWDDSEHVTRAGLQSLHGLFRIWFELNATQQYYPVLHSVFWIEHRLWGDAPLGYHLANVALHATAAWLLAVLLGGAGGSRRGVPIFAALLFALHPVCVESVAWISEQKNTLSTVFYLLAALTYFRWRDRGRPALYGGAFALFICALLSKSVTATLPAALLVVLWWQRGSAGGPREGLSWRRDVAPLTPWFAVAAAMGVLTAWVERRYVGAEGAAYALGFGPRFFLAARAVWFYLGKLFWPSNLTFVYPRWQIAGEAGIGVLALGGVLALAAALWLLRARMRAPLAAFLFFAGSLFPALGFFNIYPFVYAYVADHFQYLASLGVFAAVAGGWGMAAGRPANAWPFRLFALLLLAALGVLTWRQSGKYRSVEMLYRDTLAKNPACWMAHTNLGLALAERGRLPEAIAEYEQALRGAPDRPEVVHTDLGRALLDSGRPAEAIAQWDEALRLKPDYAKAHLNLGDAFLAQHRLPAAIAHFEEDLRLDPEDYIGRNNLGIALAESGRLPEAAARFEEALQLNPDYDQARRNLARARAQLHGQ